ncbi:glycosyltransferase family 2 protein [Liquorilactobacillus mali]|uniref:glycosyltransferase family 2 protein n=1 Tax=Liquorilactobacillus mali TaxID=1618 RepID=UPI0039EA2DCA
MNYTPKISVVIPLFNAEKYIYKALKSIFIQNYKNVQAIVVDDCSTDNSLLEVKKYIRDSENNIEIICLNKSFGPSKCRNVGFEKAEGEYIFFLDADDMMADHFFEACTSLLELNKNIEVINFKSYFFDNEMHKFSKGYEKLKNNFIYSRDDFLNLIYKQRVTAVWMYLYSRKFLEKISPLFFEGIYYEDALFTEKVILNMKTIGFLDEHLMYHRINNLSITQNIQDENFRIISYKNVIVESNKMKSNIPPLSNLENKYINYQNSISFLELIKFKNLKLSGALSFKSVNRVRLPPKIFLKVVKYILKRVG